MAETSGFDPKLIAAFSAAMSQVNDEIKKPTVAQLPPVAPLEIDTIDPRGASGALIVNDANRAAQNDHGKAKGAWDEKDAAFKRYLKSIYYPENESITSESRAAMARAQIKSFDSNNPKPAAPELQKLSSASALVSRIALSAAMGTDRVVDLKKVFQKNTDGENFISVPTDGAVTAIWDDSAYKYRVFVHPANLPDFGAPARPTSFDGGSVLLSREEIENKTTFSVLQEGRRTAEQYAQIPVRFVSQDPNEIIKGPLKIYVVNAPNARFGLPDGVRILAANEQGTFVPQQPAMSNPAQRTTPENAFNFLDVVKASMLEEGRQKRPEGVASGQYSAQGSISGGEEGHVTPSHRRQRPQQGTHRH